MSHIQKDWIFCGFDHENCNECEFSTNWALLLYVELLNINYSVGRLCLCCSPLCVQVINVSVQELLYATMNLNNVKVKDMRLCYKCFITCFYLIRASVIAHCTVTADLLWRGPESELNFILSPS